MIQILPLLLLLINSITTVVCSGLKYGTLYPFTNYL